MSIPDTFGELLRQRARRLGLVKDGEADSAQVADYLTSRGIKCTKRTVESYFNGERAPRIGKMEMVLDALDVHGVHRLRAYRLVMRLKRDPVDPAHETSEAPVDPASTL